MTVEKLKIVEPITEQDFEKAYQIVKKNIADWADHRAEHLKNLSFGEILVAKMDGRVGGVLEQRRPGKVFGETKDKYFALDKINCSKDEIGHINVVAVSEEFQKQGIGKLLLKKALLLQRDFGAKCVNVFVWQSSPGMGSQKLFESFGFEAIQYIRHPWLEHSKKVGPKEYWCVVCGNPCKCDELEMIYYL